jgi:hypothetical protein
MPLSPEEIQTIIDAYEPSGKSLTKASELTGYSKNAVKRYWALHKLVPSLAPKGGNRPPRLDCKLDLQPWEEAIIRHAYKTYNGNPEAACRHLKYRRAVVELCWQKHGLEAKLV